MHKAIAGPDTDDSVRTESAFLTDYEVAEEVGVGVESVRRWMRRGDLPAVKMGRHWRIPRPVWERFLSTGEWS